MEHFIGAGVSQVMGLVGAILLAAFFGLYLLLEGELSASECGTGVAVAFFIVVFVYAQRRVVQRAIRLRAPVRAFVGPLGAVLPDAWRVGRMLLASLARRPPDDAGSVACLPFRFGGPAAEEAGRRALVVLGISLAPNAFVLGAAPERDVLLVHTLACKRMSADPEWPA